jgi:hypothetical protein
MNDFFYKISFETY